MRKIKIFSENDYLGIEREVGTWLVLHKDVIIQHVLQTERQTDDGDCSLTITIFYYEGEQNA